MRTFIKSLTILIGCTASCSVSAQYILPKVEVIKQNQIAKIAITKHTLPDLALDSTIKRQNVIDKQPFIWAVYWFNTDGKPDSMANYLKGIRYRTESYTYDKKGDMTAICVLNQHKDTTSYKQTVSLSKRRRVTTHYEKSTIKGVTYCDKNGHVYLSKKYLDSKIFGYDSLVYSVIDDNFISTEKYYANGKISHQLTTKWIGSPPDSFYEAFYQSTVEAGRMPGYQCGFAVNDSGHVVVPDSFPFPELFRHKNFNHRYQQCQSIDQTINSIMVGATLETKSSVIQLKTPKAISRHYFTFEYAYY